jgi:hypothetical protein
MSNNKKRSKAARIPPDVAAQYFSHLSSAAAKVDRDPPCSPEEVKALMGMFAEIMGMAEKKSSVSFMFGSKGGGGREWPPSALAAAARAASMYMPPEDFLDYDDEEEDDEEDEEEDDDEEEDEDEGDEDVDTKRPAIDPSEWKDLEQVARDEKREEEARELKAAKKREKKQRKKERLRKESTDKAAEAALKKQDKLVTSWKSRVVAACQSHDTTKLQGLLGESPFKKGKEDAEEHVEFLLPNCVAKTRDAVDTGTDCRLKLADFILNTSFTAFFAISAKTGRNSLHSACFVGDFYFVQFVLEHYDSSDDEDEADAYLSTTCEESGFAPIHYAVLSGSKQLFEILLAHGCNVQTSTDEDMTGRDGKGITAIELAEAVLAGKQDDVKTDGSALQDAITSFQSNRDDLRRYHSFLRFVIERLTDVAKNGHSPPPGARKEEDPQEQHENQKSLSKSKKKKKKKKQQQQEQNSAPPPTPAAPLEQEDPMIAALLGMGFSNEQIQAAAKACGGTARATADDLVMWIFTQEAGGDAQQAPQPDEEIPAAAAQPVEQELVEEWTEETAEFERLEAARKAEEARLAQQRLLQKREEQRRRNRDWNDREQARHTQAKLTAVQKTRVGQPPVYGSAAQPVLDLHGQTAGHAVKQRAMPNGVHHGQKNGLYAGATAAAAKPPAVPIKILTRPKTTPEGINNVILPLNVKKHPPGLETIGADFSRIGSSGIAEDATVSSLGSGIVGQNDWMNETDSLANDPPVLAGFLGVPATGATPPGFQFGGSQYSPEISFTGSDPLAFAGDPNPMGEIRATARAFVPTSFKPPPGLSNGPVGYPVSELSTIGELNHGAHLNPLASLLPGGLAPPQAGQQPFVQQVLNGFDHMQMATPTTSYSPSPSATSSVTGISATDDLLAQPGVGFPTALGLGGWENNAAPIGSIHDPLALGGAQPEPNILWGGAAPTQQVAGAPLGGLASLGEVLPSLGAFGGAFGALNSSEEDKNNGAAASRGGWGTTTSSSIW